MVYVSDFQVTPITPNFPFLEEITREMAKITEEDIAAAEPREELSEKEPVIGVFTREEMVMAALEHKLISLREKDYLRRTLQHLIQASKDRRLEVDGVRYTGYLSRAEWKIVGYSRQDIIESVKEPI